MMMSAILRRALIGTAVLAMCAGVATAPAVAQSQPTRALNPSMGIYNPHTGSGYSFFPPLWYQDVPSFLHDGWDMTATNDSGYDLCLGDWVGNQPTVIKWVPANGLTYSVPGGRLDFVADCAYFT